MSSENVIQKVKLIIMLMMIFSKTFIFLPFAEKRTTKWKRKKNRKNRIRSGKSTGFKIWS